MPGGPSRTTRIAWIAAGAAAVFALWLAVSSASSGVAFFYSIPVGLAAWWFGRDAGLLTAVLCVGLYAIGSAIHPVPDFALAAAIRAAFLVGAALLAAALAGRLRSLEHSAEELEAIRAALTPAALPELPGVDAGAAFVPSELGVSGDFYLLTNGPDGSAIAVVGDVVGHGPRAARLATFVRARLAAFASGTSDPAELLRLVNTALAERPDRKQELVSAICVRLHPDEDTVCWARAGHPPPLRLPDLRELSADGTTFLLGAEKGLELENTESLIAGSEGLVVYTDGATDVRRGKEMLGLEGLTEVLAPLSGLAARVMVSETERAILAWADRPIRDDLCLVVLKPNSA
ncbi:MAG TPA: PP2C family protein-serine/threonine phosphatase [Solirubrobacterales bacterium]|nr:PP2C family protein-serine/threonine phosphatase [Solirubrobacterales bacterium]